MQHDLINID